jgi:hypothetical protein
MTVRETAKPCFVVVCDECGCESWPPSTTMSGAIILAKTNWNYVRDGDYGDLCEGCTEKLCK